MKRFKSPLFRLLATKLQPYFKPNYPWYIILASLKKFTWKNLSSFKLHFSELQQVQHTYWCDTHLQPCMQYLFVYAIELSNTVIFYSSRSTLNTFITHIHGLCNILYNFNELKTLQLQLHTFSFDNLSYCYYTSWAL